MPLIVQNRSKIVAGVGLRLLCKVVALSLLFAASIKIAALVNQAVPLPFIDEKFHLRQCQAYCAGRLSQWDPKITTPPGLYLLGAVYAKAIDNLPGSLRSIPLTEILRSLNLLGGLVALPVTLARFKRFSPDQFWTVNVVAQPLLFSYYYLFYTDVWSTILICASLASAMHKPMTWRTSCTSASCGFASLWFRQTNIVWLAFIAVVAIERSNPRLRQEQGVVQQIVRFVGAGITKWHITVPYAMVFIVFGVFLGINGGITLGDKENHAMTLHFAQVLYCFAFIALFSWPVWLCKRTTTDYVRYWRGNRGLNVILNLGACYLLQVAINKFTIAHPFLLADNRHYAFYIYRKIISRPYSLVVLVPLYHFSIWATIDALGRARRLALGWICTVAFIGATVITLVPSPLFEPRYYIVPVVFARIFMCPRLPWRHILEYSWLNCINAFTMYVFLTRTFAWPSEPEVLQRIIW